MTIEEGIVPERRTSFDDESRIIMLIIITRPTLSRESSTSSSEIARIPITSIIGCGGGPASPIRPDQEEQLWSPPHRELLLEEAIICLHLGNINQVIFGSEKGTTFPAIINHMACNAIIDTGASRSCIR